MEDGEWVETIHVWIGKRIGRRVVEELEEGSEVMVDSLTFEGRREWIEDRRRGGLVYDNPVSLIAPIVYRDKYPMSASSISDRLRI